MNLNRKDGESYFEYKKRLIVSKIDKEVDLEWEDIRDLLGETCSPCHLRKTAYGIYEFDKYLKDKSCEQLDNTALEILTEKKLELQKERVKLQSEKAEINKWIREQSRSELFEEKLIEAIKSTVKLEPPEFTPNTRFNENVGILTIADCHFGRQVVIRGLEGEIINEYNVDVFKHRMDLLLQKTIEKIIKEDIIHLKLINLSDSIDGILRYSQLQSLQFGLVESVIQFADYLAKWINSLSKYATIDYYAVGGNHDEIRVLNSQRGDFPHENAEILINRMIELSLSNNSNVKINPVNAMQYIDVSGIKVLALHGEYEKKTESSIKEYSLMYNKPINMMLSGHLHSYKYADILPNMEVYGIPSICGVDEYAMKLKKINDAGAVLITISNGVKDAVYSINLQK